MTHEPSHIAPLCASLRFLSASEKEAQSPAEHLSAPASDLRRVGGRLALLGDTPGVPPSPAARMRCSGRPEQEEKGWTSRPAPQARAHGAHLARTRRAPAHLPACNRHVFRRATRAFSGAQNPRVFRCAEPARLSARRSARFPARRTACLLARERRVYRRENKCVFRRAHCTPSAACKVFSGNSGLVFEPLCFDSGLLLCNLSGWATFALNHCRWVSIRRAPFALAAAPSAESRRASPAVACVTSWNNQLQRVNPGLTPGCNQKAQGMCIYRLEARVARFSGAQPAFSAFRSLGQPSACTAGCLGGFIDFGSFQSCVGSDLVNS